MWPFILRRITIMIPLLVLISIISFIVIELPPGDYMTTYIMAIEAQTGEKLEENEIVQLRAMYGLDQPVYGRYLRWMGNVVRGNFGRSFQENRSVGDVLKERLPLTVVISLASLIFAWGLAIPIGIYSATHQYSLVDYSFTFIGFIGLATPPFLLAIIFMWIAFSMFGISATGLFSKDFVDAAWNWAKIIDLLKHIWVPIIIIGMASTARLIRIMRANLLDELRKQYVVTARAKGLTEGKLLFKYPVRMAINPLISTIGWILPGIISGGALVAIVLNLQTVGPVLFRSILSQDMYLAGSIVLILSSLTITGTFISDILLAWLDPRIRFGGATR